MRSKIQLKIIWYKVIISEFKRLTIASPNGSPRPLRHIRREKALLPIVHFTVTGGNEAGVDFDLIQPFLLCYVNHVVLMLTSIF